METTKCFGCFLVKNNPWEILKYGNMKIWKDENMERWKDGKMNLLERLAMGEAKSYKSKVFAQKNIKE